MTNFIVYKSGAVKKKFVVIINLKIIINFGNTSITKQLSFYSLLSRVMDVLLVISLVSFFVLIIFYKL